MRIGLISPYSLTVPGGVQGQILGLARALRVSGESVRVLGPCDGPPPEPFVTPLGNSLPTGANGSIAPIAPDPAAQLRTIRAIRDERFDVLHVHEPFAPGPTMTALLVKSSPVVATFHAAGASRAYDAFRPLLVRGMSRIDRCFAVSEAARDMACATLGGEFEIAYNGVEVDLYRLAEPYPTCAPTIFFVARHEERKGLEVLLHALRSIDVDCRVWIGGIGPETDRLRESFDDPRIEWLGELAESDKIARMRGADVFCAPSIRGESFGIVLLEAMASGTAVVASSLDGYARVARHGRDAVLVPPGDVRQLAVELTRVLSDEDLRSRLVSSGHERVGDFSMRRLADLYLEAYRQLTGATHGSR